MCVMLCKRAILSSKRRKIYMKALIYARQSSGKDDLSESVEAQIANCRKLAEKENLEIIEVFRDLNCSGETYPEGAENIAAVDNAYKDWIINQSSRKSLRHGLGQALTHLSDVDYILVNEMTRLYRPINGSFLEGHINQLLRTHNVKVLQVQGGSIDLSKFDQQLITSIKNQILYDDLQKKRQNSINAFNIKRDSGKQCTGTKAFGLRYLGNDKIEVIPECIEIIRFIYDKICEYKSYRSIIKDCNERWHKERFFYESSIYSIAKQPLYAGYQYNTAGELIKNIQLTGQEIVSFEQWNTVQKIISTKRKEYHCRTKKSWLPLSGKLYCGECGSRLIYFQDHGCLYYICNKKNLDRGHYDCRNSRIRFETGSKGKPSLYDAIFPLLSIALIERHKKASELLHDRKDIAKYEVELENMNLKERKIFDLYSEGLASEEQLRNILINHKSKRQKLEKKILEIKSSMVSESTLEELQYHVLSELFNELAAKTLSNNIYATLLNEAEITATVFRNRVEFHTKYGNVTIPRIQVKTRFWMPEWELELINTNNKHSRAIDENTKITVTYLTGENATLANFGQLKIKSK